MAAKRVEQGRGRAKGVVKGSKGGTSRTFYILIAAIAVAGIGTLTWLTTRQQTGAGITAVDPNLPPVESEGYVAGSPSAPIEVIEFADFECPACAQFATLTAPDVKRRLVDAGQIRLRFVDFPLPGHQNTWNASRAAACGDEQGKFWEMHDVIFQNQDRWNGAATRNPDKVLKDIARNVPGLDLDRFDDCVDSRRTQAKVQAHNAMAEQYQVTQTPSFVIGGKKVPGSIPYDDFKRLVDEAIAAAPAAGPAVGGDTALTDTTKRGGSR